MELTVKVILLVLLVCAVILVVHFIISEVKYRKKPYDKMSFRETMDLCELPIVTFNNNGTKLNFLLDTGSSKSVIDTNALSGHEYTVVNKSGDIYGADGVRRPVSFINMDIEYKNKYYNEEFQVLDLSVPFGNLKSDYGVNLHGILSSAFFQKYRYILNFDELIAYSKA